MKRFAMSAVMLATVLAAGVPGAASAAVAQSSTASDVQKTPKDWNYVIKDGKRVPKASRVTNADGSWREETKVGNCVTIKEGSASGEVKITRNCG